MPPYTEQPVNAVCGNIAAIISNTHIHAARMAVQKIKQNMAEIWDLKMKEDQRGFSRETR
jgi:hypothetical protein